MTERRRLPVIDVTPDEAGITRPRVVDDCRNGKGVRPCPWFSCRFNLLVDVLEDGSIVLNARSKRLTGASRVLAPRREVDDAFDDEAEDAVEEWFDEPDPFLRSCVLDETSRIDREDDDHQLDEIADVMLVSRERVRQIEASGLAKLRAAGLTVDDLHELVRSRGDDS